MAARIFFELILVGLLALSIEAKFLSKCGNEGEVFTNCASRCGEPTCDGIPQILCALVCVNRCICDNDNDYVRGPKGDCILSSNCPQAQLCQEGETYSVCRPPCSEPLCPGYPLPDCAAGAPCITGCFCNKGLVRYNGQCISPDDCPPYCAEGYVNCLVDPCQFATCAAFPTAICVSNYCGGCNAIFYDEADQEVICDAAAA